LTCLADEELIVTPCRNARPFRRSDAAQDHRPCRRSRNRAASMPCVHGGFGAGTVDGAVGNRSAGRTCARLPARGRPGVMALHRETLRGGPRDSLHQWGSRRVPIRPAVRVGSAIGRNALRGVVSRVEVENAKAVSILLVAVSTSRHCCASEIVNCSSHFRSRVVEEWWRRRNCIGRAYLCTSFARCWDMARLARLVS
jgi:hypothetical protein